MPKKINNKSYSAIELIDKLNNFGGKNGIGRVDCIENRLIGIKSREIYEAPAATILYAAHKELEAMVLDKEFAHYKEGRSSLYGELIYNGLWYSDVRIGISKFIEESQKNVTGIIKLKLYKGNCIVVGRKSPHSLYKHHLATYSSGDKFDQRLSEGFIKLFGLPYVH